MHIALTHPSPYAQKCSSHFTAVGNANELVYVSPSFLLTLILCFRVTQMSNSSCNFCKKCTKTSEPHPIGLLYQRVIIWLSISLSVSFTSYDSLLQVPVIWMWYLSQIPFTATCGSDWTVGYSLETPVIVQKSESYVRLDRDRLTYNSSFKWSLTGRSASTSTKSDRK